MAAGNRLAPRRHVHLVPVTASDRPALASLDWVRSLHPAMGGWLSRAEQSLVSTFFVCTSDGEPVGVVDAAPLPGYDGVTSLSLYVDADRAAAGWAFEAYALAVVHLFDTGTRLIHHEVLSFNDPITRLLRGVGLAPSARLREHAYAAGRLWDVLVYSYDATRWRHLFERVAPRNPVRARGAVPAVPTAERDAG